MKIPGANPARQVQSLGRQDPGGPMRVANAQARAAEYEGIGLRQLGAEVKELGEWMQQRQKQEAVEQYNNAMLLARAEAGKAMGMLEQPTMAVDTPGLEGMDFQRDISVTDGGGNVTTQPRKEVRTYEVGGPWLTSRLDAIQKAALENISDERAKNKFRSEWALRSADWTTKASTMLRKKRRADKLGGMQFQLDEYVRIGDEESATALVHQSVASGLLDGTQGAKALLQIGEDIDQRVAFDMIADRDAENDLDEVQDILESGNIIDPVTGEIRQARFSPEMAQQLVRMARQKEREFEADRSERYDDGKTRATQMFLQRNLRITDLKEMLRKDEIDASFALSMEQKLKSRATEGAGKSNKDLVRSLTVSANRLNSVEGDVRASATLLRERVQGYILDGQVTTTDGQRLLDEIDQREEEIFKRPEVRRGRDAIIDMAGGKKDLIGGFTTDNPADAYRVFNALQEFDARLNSQGDNFDVDAYVSGVKPTLEFESTESRNQTTKKFASTIGAKYRQFLPKFQINQGDATQGEWRAAQWKAAILSAIDAGVVTYEEAQRDLDLLNGARIDD